jgi:hypothetical protein
MSETNITLDTITEWVHSREGDLLEFKREWPDLFGGEGKVAFVKQVLALANTTRPQEPGYLVFGFGDEPGPNRVVGVSASPKEEQVNQILASYTHPVPAIDLSRIELGHKVIDVVRVKHDPYKPHYATRRAGNLLSDSVAYVRRGPIIDTATMVEVESMMRQKNANFQPMLNPVPIECGFVEIPIPGTYPRVMGRIRNISGHPVTIMTSWNAVWAADQRAVDRSGSFNELKLFPGEAREDEKLLSSIHFYIEGEPVGRRGYSNERWMDLTWTVHYREPDGFIKTIEHFVRIAL